MKKKEEELKRNTQKTLETNFIFKNQRNRQELKKEKSKIREKESSWSYWLPKNIKRD